MFARGKIATAVGGVGMGLLIAACGGSAQHPAWCGSAERLHITAAEPAMVQRNLLLVKEALALSNSNALVSPDTMAQLDAGVKAGDALKPVMRARCGYGQ